MHPLVPFYALFSLLTLLGLRFGDARQRTGVWVMAWSAMTVVLLAVILRPVVGDTWRYEQSFLRWSSMPLGGALKSGEDSWLFIAINWVAGQVSHNVRWLIVPVTLFCVGMLWHSLRQVLSPLYAAVGILLYSVYPYFLFYIASGMKQALAMAALLQAFVSFKRGRKRAWIWLLLAMGFHSGSALVLPFLALHLLTFRPGFSYRRAMWLSFGLLAGAIFLALTGLNKALLFPLQDLLAISNRYEIYFTKAADVGYHAGFRLDFTAFSLLPFLAVYWLRGHGRGLSPEVSGWWLSLYALLNCIYQLFAFAPFADRFASFSWYLMPMILMIMLAESGKHRDLQILLSVFAIFNILILQFYSGSALHMEF